MTRGVLGGVAASVIALVNHTGGEGHPPPVLNVLVAALLAVFVCTALGGRAFSWWRTGIAIGLSQILLHAVLVLPLGIALDAFGVGGAIAEFTHVFVSHGHHPPHSLTDVGMWFWHAIGISVTTVLLVNGERVLALVSRLLAWLGLDPHRYSSPTPRVDGVTSAWTLSFAWHPTSRLLLSTASRRGPPLPIR